MAGCGRVTGPRPYSRSGWTTDCRAVRHQPIREHEPSPRRRRGTHRGSRSPRVPLRHRCPRGGHRRAASPTVAATLLLPTARAAVGNLDRLPTDSDGRSRDGTIVRAALLNRLPPSRTRSPPAASSRCTRPVRCVLAHIVRFCTMSRPTALKASQCAPRRPTHCPPSKPTGPGVDPDRAGEGLLHLDRSALRDRDRKAAPVGSHRRAPRRGPRPRPQLWLDRGDPGDLHDVRREGRSEQHHGVKAERPADRPGARNHREGEPREAKSRTPVGWGPTS